MWYGIHQITLISEKTLQWRHNGRDGISNHQPHHCLLNRLFRRRSKKASKLRVTGRCAGNSPVTGEFPAQMASNAENVSNWWRHHENKFHHVIGGSLRCALPYQENVCGGLIDKVTKCLALVDTKTLQTCFCIIRMVVVLHCYILLWEPLSVVNGWGPEVNRLLF